MESRYYTSPQRQTMDVMDRVFASHNRKRKAEHQENDRLSKRLSLLNLERNPPQGHNLSERQLSIPTESPPRSPKPFKKTSSSSSRLDDDIMYLDDTKDKVYIYNLDDELSDSEKSEDGKVIFAPDFKRMLKGTPIPPAILASSPDVVFGSALNRKNSQLILWRQPESYQRQEGAVDVKKEFLERRALEKERQMNAEAALPDVNFKGLGRDGVYTNAMGREDGVVEEDPETIMEVDEYENDSDAMDLG